MPAPSLSLDQVLSLFECIHSGIIAVDAAGKVIVCNAAARKILEVGPEVVGTPISNLLPETKLLEIINSGRGDYGKQFSYKDKTYVVNRTPIFAEGELGQEVVGAVTVFQDVTELEEISTELESFKKVNKELEGIFASSYDGIIITDGEGNVLKINQALLRVTDLTREDFLGQKIDSLYEKEIFSYEAVAKRARVGKKLVTGIQRIKTGKEVIVSATPVFDDDGNVIRVVTNVRDMSDLVKLEEELNESRQLSDQLRSQFNKLLEEELRSHGLVTQNPEMFRLLDMIRRVAASDVTVLVQGESGVGKEVFAKLIHIWSQRKGAFIKVNCSALPGHLLESELFGYSKGAFTGANSEGKPGLFELAQDGTLFLDEIEDLPLELQGKFLRVLQDGEFMRLGGTKYINVNVRLIAASNKDLSAMVSERLFRQDLYYRLNVVPLTIPPLRQRIEDIPVLVEFFVEKFNRKYGTVKTVSPELMQRFTEYDWPGNIRELANILERLVLLSPGERLTPPSWFAGQAELPMSVAQHELVRSETEPGVGMPPSTPTDELPKLKDALARTELELLSQALRKYKDSRSIGRALGISHTAVLKKLRKYRHQIGNHSCHPEA
ncbi:sigma-54-dependent Fis family transcriptional regulator [Paradesulfitobacterium aromaticivorans]